MDQFVVEKAAGPARTRFVLLGDQPHRVVRAAAEPAPSRVTWRLVAANNRPIGQAAVVFATVAECIDNIALLSAGVAQASVSVLFHPASASSAGSHWSWSISLADQVVAGSSRRYQRRIECERALRHFLSAARATPLPPVEVRRIGQRLGTCPA